MDSSSRPFCLHPSGRMMGAEGEKGGRVSEAEVLCAAVVWGSGCAGGSSGTKTSLGIGGTYVSTASDGMYQRATIKGNDITIEWVNDEEGMAALYWKGDIPEGTMDAGSLEFTSRADREKMDKSLLASQDETKTFSLEDGTLFYEAAVNGTTRQMELKKQTKNLR